MSPFPANPLLSPVRKPEGVLADKAQEYDRALRQSQFAARRRGPGGASVMGMSALNPTGPSASSIFGPSAMAGAQTAVLGDSRGSVMPEQSGGGDAVSSLMPEVEASRIGAIPDEELGPDGEVGGGLGGSYVDGARRAGKPLYEEEEDDEGVEDGGVLGLLAQIYGRRDGPRLG